MNQPRFHALCRRISARIAAKDATKCTFGHQTRMNNTAKPYTFGSVMALIGVITGHRRGRFSNGRPVETRGTLSAINSVLIVGNRLARR